MLLTVRPATSWSLEVFEILYQGGKSRDCYFMLRVGHPNLIEI